MKTLKEGLFWFTMFYVVIVSFLFIRQAFIVHDTMYKPIVLDPNEKYETFIAESRTKLANYKSLAKTQEEINCLNEVERAINISYQKQHASITNYKEAKEYYYKTAEDEELHYNNYLAVKKTCDVDNKNSEKYNQMLKYLMGNVALVEGKLIETNVIYQITLPSFTIEMLKDIATPAFDITLLRTGQDLRSLVINNDINYIDTILNLVGENYEIK